MKVLTETGSDSKWSVNSQFTDADFYDEVRDFKISENGKLCLYAEDYDWDFVLLKTNLLLCQKMNLDPNADNPLINMMMEGMGWISHAKNFGVIVKRTESGMTLEVETNLGHFFLSDNNKEELKS